LRMKVSGSEWQPVVDYTDERNHKKVTPQTEPIPCKACYGEFKMNLYDCKRCNWSGEEPLSRKIENSIPVSPPLESKYEE
jgi:hypothetical protein